MPIEQLANLPILKRLPDDVLKQVAASGCVRSLSVDEEICQVECSADNLFWVLEGRVKTFVGETVIDILSRGKTLGLVEMCGDGPYSVSATALEETRCFVLAKDEFGKLMADYGDFQMAVFANISAEMRGAVKEINDLKLKNTARRLGAYLIAMVDDEEGEINIELSFGKRLLAARLAMKPESLSRALSKLKSVGVTSSRTAIHIDDLERLREYCGEDDFGMEGI